MASHQQRSEIADISVGDYVRSYNFHSRNDCYIEGHVLEIGKTPFGHNGYTILVEKQVFAGEDITIKPFAGNFTGKKVFPPLNGSEGMFGPTKYVHKLVELKHVPHGYTSGEHNWKIGEKYEIVGTMGHLVVVVLPHDRFPIEVSIHPDYFKD